MEFNETLALELIEKYQLGKNTIKVWKTRGKIPDKYFSGNYQKPEPIAESDINLKMVIAFLERDDIVTSRFVALAGILPQKYLDVKRKKYALNKQEIMALKKVIVSFFNDLKKITDTDKGEKLLKTLLSRHMIYNNKVFAEKYFFSQTELGQIFYWLDVKRNGPMHKELRTKIVNRLFEFETEANKFY